MKRYTLDGTLSNYPSCQHLETDCTHTYIHFIQIVNYSLPVGGCGPGIISECGLYIFMWVFSLFIYSSVTQFLPYGISQAIAGSITYSHVGAANCGTSSAIRSCLRSSLHLTSLKDTKSKVYSGRIWSMPTTYYIYKILCWSKECVFQFYNETKSLVIVICCSVLFYSK